MASHADGLLARSPTGIAVARLHTTSCPATAACTAARSNRSSVDRSNAESGKIGVVGGTTRHTGHVEARRDQLGDHSATQHPGGSRNEDLLHVFLHL